jgi:hypothetical protein
MADAANIMIAVGGDVNVADAGATMPTEVSEAIDAAFDDVGYVSQEGATWRPGPGEREPTRVWQTTLPVKYRPNADRTLQLSFALAEFNSVTVPIALGGGTVIDIAGDGSQGYRYDPPAADAIVEKAIVVDWTYNGFNYRLAIPRVMATGDAEHTFAWTAETSLPVVFNVLEEPGVLPYALYSDHPGFAPVP